MKLYHYLTKGKKMKNTETGRSMVEIIVVLAIIAVLSVVGAAGYMLSMRQNKINDILTTLQVNIVTIHSAMQGRTFSSLEEKNAFLSNYTSQVGEYQLSFYATEGNDGFVTKITTDSGDSIKGAMCRKLISEMARQSFVYDVDFTVTGEETDEEGYLEKVTVPLNGQVVDMDAICGD